MIRTQIFVHDDAFVHPTDQRAIILLSFEQQQLSARRGRKLLLIDSTTHEDCQYLFNSFQSDCWRNPSGFLSPATCSGEPTLVTNPHYFINGLQLIAIHLLKFILFNDSVRTPNNRHFPIPMSSIDGNPLINSKPSFNRIPFFIAPPEFDSIANGRVQIHSGPQLLFLHIAVSRCIVRLPGPERLDQGLL